MRFVPQGTYEEVIWRYYVKIYLGLVLIFIWEAVSSREAMKSIKIDDPRDFKQKLLWCLFWANRKAIRTEGCAPFSIEQIVTGKTTYVPELGKILKLSNSLFETIEKETAVGNTVEFTIKMGEETFDLAFKDNVFSVATRKNKEIEAEIVECLDEEMKRGKPKICPSFPQRIGSDIQV